LRKKSGPLQHRNNFFSAGSQFMCRVEQIIGTHGVPVMTRRIAKAAHVEGLDKPLNVRRERG
jgi:hypothetical protein